MNVKPVVSLTSLLSKKLLGLLIHQQFSGDTLTFPGMQLALEGCTLLADIQQHSMQQINVQHHHSPVTDAVRKPQRSKRGLYLLLPLYASITNNMRREALCGPVVRTAGRCLLSPQGPHWPAKHFLRTTYHQTWPPLTYVEEKCHFSETVG